jgi:hypothetical protein
LTCAAGGAIVVPRGDRGAGCDGERAFEVPTLQRRQFDELGAQTSRRRRMPRRFGGWVRDRDQRGGEPHFAGWQQKFDLDWQVKPEPGGTQRIQGYLVSLYGRNAEPVRVLVQALDGSGAAVGHRIVWIPGGVSGFGRAYFDVQHLPSADHFLVSVWDYSLGREPSSSQ